MGQIIPRLEEDRAVSAQALGIMCSGHLGISGFTLGSRSHLCSLPSQRQGGHTEDPVCEGNGHSCLAGSEPLCCTHQRPQLGEGCGHASCQWSNPFDVNLPLAPSCPGPENQAWSWFPCATHTTCQASTARIQLAPAVSTVPFQPSPATSLALDADPLP